MPLGSPRRERQHAVAAIERLNGGLFVHAEDRRVLRRIEIEPDDVGRLALEVRIVRRHVALQTMRLKTGFAPDEMNHRLAHAELVAELAAGPMRRTVARFAAGGVEDSGPRLGSEFAWRLPGALGFQAVESGLEEAPLPLADRTRRGVEFVDDLAVGPAVGQQQHDLGSKNKARRQRLRVADVF